MASITSAVASGMASFSLSLAEVRSKASSCGGRGGRAGSIRAGKLSFPASSGSAGRRQRAATVVVRAEGINPEVRKNEEKVVDSVVVSELSKPLTAYCRCWRSKAFPLCDGSHVKHNKATGDNVGPLLLKKQ